MALVDACQVEGVLGIKERELNIEEERRSKAKLERRFRHAQSGLGTSFLALRHLLTTSIAREALKRTTLQTCYSCYSFLQLLGI